MRDNLKLAFYATVGWAPTLCVWGLSIYYGFQYRIHVEGHLKRAADANTVERAKRELDTAIDAIEDRGWTEGSSHALFATPDCDVGFWYTNLKESSEELATVGHESPPLERSNMLMKLRETIIDEGDVVSVTSPQGISMFPRNKLFFWSSCLALVWGVGVTSAVLWLEG